MFDINLNFITTLPEIIKNYVAGIFFCKEKKNCRQLSKTMNCTRNSMVRVFKNAGEYTKILKSKLLGIVKDIPDGALKVLVIDDMLIKKVFGDKIEGRCVGYDSSLKKLFYGLTMVTAGIAWAGGFLPLDFKYWVQEAILGKEYKKKWELAIILIDQIFKEAGKMIIVADAWYFSIGMIKALNERDIQFVMKAKSTIKIEHDGICQQLRHHPSLKILRNARKKTIYATYKGVPLWFTIEKLRMKNGEWAYRYFASNFEAPTDQYLEVYYLRWPTEKCNRTSKQMCGIGDCQMKEIEKQELHAFSVYLAYAQAEFIKIKNHLANTEAVFHKARSQNATTSKSKDLT